MEPDLPRITEELSQLLRTRLGVRGKDLPTKLRRAGRLLPRPVRRAAWELVEKERLWPNPKLRRQIDPAAVEAAARRVRTHLESIDAAERRRSYWIGVLTPLAFNFLLILAGVTTFLVWTERL